MASTPRAPDGQLGPDEIILLDRSDDIDILLDRLEWVEGRHALIVVPGVSDMLASLVALRLLERRARALQLDVLLVARDGQTRALAKEAGIRVFPFKWMGQLALRRLQRRHGTPRKAVARTSEAPAAAQEAGQKKPKGKKRRKPARQPGDRFRLRTLRGRGRLTSQLVALLVLIALAAALAYTVLMLVPAATVTVVPATKRVSETVTLVADLETRRVDYAARRIPARVVEVRVEGTAQIPTVSKIDAPNNRATGTIFFINKTPQEVVAPPGTVVRTSTGTNIRFTTVQTATVPAGVGSRAGAEIVAVAPGPSGNVRAYSITTVEGSLGIQLAAVNDEPTRGGDVRQVGVVTQADKARLKQLLLQQLRQEAYARIQDQLGEQEFAPPETLQAFVVSELYDKFVDELSDSLGLKIEVAANAIAIAGYDANAVALDALQSATSSDYYIVAQGLTFERGDVQQIDERRRVTFPMTASGIAVSRIETRGLREALRGQPIARAERILMDRLPLKEPPAIEVSPDWFGVMPQLPFRITIVVRTVLD